MTIKNAVLVATLDCVIFHPLDTIKTRIQTNNFEKFGFKRLYSGITPSLCNIVPKITFRLTSFDKINNVIKNPFVSGLTIGCIESVFISSPTSFYKNNYQVANGKKLNINNLFKSIPLIVSKQMLSNALFFGIYNTYKKENSFYSNLTLSGVSSFVSTFITYPIDTIRINLQTSKLDVKKLCVPTGLYKGFNIKMVRSILGKMFVLTMYDYLRVP